jgi:hypothetical protein
MLLVVKTAHLIRELDPNPIGAGDKREVNETEPKEK